MLVCAPLLRLQFLKNCITVPTYTAAVCISLQMLVISKSHLSLSIMSMSDL